MLALLAVSAVGLAGPLAHAASGPAGHAAATGAETSPAWSGTVSYVYERHDRGTNFSHDYRDTLELTISPTPDSLGYGTTTAQATVSHTDVGEGQNCTQTDTTTGSLPAGSPTAGGPVRIELNQGQASEGTVDIYVPGAQVPSTETSGPCYGVPRTFNYLIVAHDVREAYTPGQTKLDDTIITHPSSDTTETTSFHLTRPKLEVVKIELFNKDWKWNQSTSGVPAGKEYTPLEYLSASAHPYFKPYDPHLGGATLIYGTIEMTGFAQDRVTSLKLKVEGGAGGTATAEYYGGFGAGNLYPEGGFVDGPLKFTKPGQGGWLFALPSDEAAKLDPNFHKLDNDKLHLTVEAQTAWGDKAEKEAGTVEQLVRYTLPNMYLGRHPEYGGDDWVTPQTRRDLELINIWGKRHGVHFLWGQMSRMNGGRFFPHLSHNDGRNVDGWFNHYDEEAECQYEDVLGAPYVKKHCYPTAYAADVLVSLIRSYAGVNLKAIFVTYFPTHYDPFYEEMFDDDPTAVDEIRPWPEHDTHFHLRFKN